MLKMALFDCAAGICHPRQKNARGSALDGGGGGGGGSWAQVELTDALIQRI